MMKEMPPDSDFDGLHAFGPGCVDTTIREAIKMCWIMMPPSKRTADEVEAAFRHLVDRAFRDLREDEQLFGRPPSDDGPNTV